MGRGLGKGSTRKSLLTQGQKLSRPVPGLSDVVESVIHLQEKLPGDVLQSQQVLFKQRLWLDNFLQHKP